MWQTSTKTDGFTVVELLIVVAVIAILATITLVTYNGVQQRAKNTQVISGVQTYYKAMLQYAAVNGAYPTSGGCLGASYPSDVCWENNGSPQHTVSTSLDAQLSTVMSTKPVVASELFSIGIGTYRRAGLLYQTSPLRFIYYLQGASQDCVLSGATGVTEGGTVTQCLLNLPAV